MSDKSAGAMSMRAVAKRMRDNAKNRAIQENGCKQIFCHLSEVHLNGAMKGAPDREACLESVRIMQDDGCMEAVLHALETHKEAVRVQEFGGAVLGLATWKEFDAFAGYKKRCIAAILWALTLLQHYDASKASIFLKCVFLLGQQTTQIIDDIIATGAMSTILNTMRHHSQHDKVQCGGMEVIVQMLLQETKLASDFIECHGLEVLITAMNRHRMDDELQAQACCLLDKILELSGCIPANLINDCMNCTLQAVEGFPRHVKLQYYGLSSIASWCRTANGIQLVGIRGVDAILAAMNNHKGSAVIQKVCGACTGDLCTDKDMAAHLAHRGGIEAMLDGVHRVDMNEKVHDRVCAGVLSIMTMFMHADWFSEKCAVLYSPRCLDALCYMLAGHTMNASIQSKCVIIIMCLAMKPKNVRLLFTARCCELLLTAITTHKKDRVIQASALGAGLAISQEMMGSEPHAVRKYFGFRVVEPSLEALESHQGDKQVEISAIGMLFLFAFEESYVEYIVRRDALRRIFDVGRRLNKHIALLRKFLGVVSSLDANTCRVLGELGMIEQLYTVVRTCNVLPSDIFDLFEDAIAHLKLGGGENLAKIEACERKRMKKKVEGVCAVCGNNAMQAGREVLLKCSCTFAPLYCSVKCQHAHWKSHRLDCKADRESQDAKNVKEID